MKQTKQKNLILEAVSNRHDHPTAEIIYNELKPDHPHLSLATVYRNLNTFASNGKIRKIEIPNAKDRFDATLKAHDHALCSCCGKILDAHSNAVRKPRSLHVEGFKVEEVSILYHGVCEDCLSKLS